MKTVGETAKAYPMEYVEDGHVFENIMMGDEVDLKKFPVTKWHPEDGGHYIGTADLNIYKDPDTGWVNVGTYRSMVWKGDRTQCGWLLVLQALPELK